MRKNKMANQVVMMLFVFVVISYGYVLDSKSCKVIEDSQYVPKELACQFQGAGLYQIQTETFERLTLDRLPDDSFLQVMMPTSLQTIEIAEGSCSHVSAAPSLKVVVDGEICDQTTTPSVGSKKTTSTVTPPKTSFTPAATQIAHTTEEVTGRMDQSPSPSESSTRQQHHHSEAETNTDTDKLPWVVTAIISTAEIVFMSIVTIALVLDNLYRQYLRIIRNPPPIVNFLQLAAIPTPQPDPQPVQNPAPPVRRSQRNRQPPNFSAFYSLIIFTCF